MQTTGYVKFLAVVGVALLLVFAGCSGGQNTDPSASPTTTTQPSPTPTPHLDPTTLLSISIGSTTETGDIPITIQANTTLPSSDSSENNPGEPYFIIKINGDEIERTDQLPRERDTRYEYTLTSPTLSQYDGDSVELTVVLMDEDTVFDDEIRSTSKTISIADTGGTTPTPTPTPTATPTATPTPTSTPTPTPDDGRRTVTVTEVVDGDTVDIQHENGTLDTVRLLGIDTPEVHVDVAPGEWEGIPDTDEGRSCLRDWGHEASMVVANEIEGKTVTLEMDPAADRRGSFGRLLGYIIVDGENLNEQLVRDGYARVYDSTFSLSESFYSAEAAAQDAERGAWSCRSVSSVTPTPTPTPKETGEGDLTVTEIHADADGNDHENLNDEYIVFRNEGGESLDLSGWQVADEADHTYTFPDGFVLESGDEVTLRTGSGSDSSDELYWGSRSAIWNNGGDTISVYTDDGDLVIENGY